MSGVGLYRQGLRGCKSFLAYNNRTWAFGSTGRVCFALAQPLLPAGPAEPPQLTVLFGSSAHACGAAKGSQGFLQLICVSVRARAYVLWFANSLSRLQ